MARSYLITHYVLAHSLTAQAKTEERLRALRLRLYVSETRLQTRMAKVPPSMPHRARQEASLASHTHTHTRPAAAAPDSMGLSHMLGIACVRVVP